MPTWKRGSSWRAVAATACTWLGSAVAGIVLIPAGIWIAGAVGSAIIAGISAFIAAAGHEAPDAGGGAKSRTGGEIEMTTLPGSGGVVPGGLQPVERDNELERPLQPGGRQAPDDGSTPRRKLGHVELQFHGHVDMRQLRFSLVYHPADPQDPEEAVFLHHVRRNSGKLSFVSPQEIESHPMRFPWHHTGPRRLCGRGVRLSAGEPSCEGVLRIALQRTSKRGTTASVRMVLTPTAPQGAPGEEDLVEGLPTTMSAARQLKLREVFFVTVNTLSRAGELVYMVERDPTDPSKLGSTLIGPVADYMAVTLPHQADAVELARDGSRLYLSTLTELYEWRGEERMPAPVVDLAPTRRGWLAGMGVIDDAACLVFASGQAPGALRCRRQDTATWTQAAPLQPTSRRYGVDGDYRYSVASLGNSLVLVPDAVDHTGALRVVYVPDASLSLPRAREFTLDSRAGQAGRSVNGVLPLLREPGQDLYLLNGSFPETRGAYAVLSVHELPGPELAYLSLGPAFGKVPPLEQQRGDAAAWLGPRQTTLRVFGNIAGLTSQYYSLRERKPLAARDVHEPVGWRPIGSVRLIQREPGAGSLLVGGSMNHDGASTTALMAYRVDGYLSEPEPEALLSFPFSWPVRDMLRSGYVVQHITGDALVLSPIEDGEA